MKPHKRLIRQCEVKTAESGNFHLKYYILSHESSNCFSNESAEDVLFGIYIKKEAIREGSLITCEEESICGFSYKQEETLEQINILADMLVTPISLLCIVDDYFSKDAEVS